jgi:type VI secretion system secreted protein Hcp
MTLTGIGINYVLVSAVFALILAGTDIAFAQAGGPNSNSPLSQLQNQVNSLDQRVNSFFDVFTELDARVDSFFDVFTELQNDMDDVNNRVDSFFDVFVDFQTDTNDSLNQLSSDVEQLQSQIGGSTEAQVDYFLKIDGIDGESTDKDHKDEIDVESWSWGAQSGTASRGGGAGKVSVQDFSFVHKVDKASPELFLKTANGEHIKDALLTVRKAGDKPIEYLKYKFSDILVSSVRPGGSSGDQIPLEQVSFNFRMIEVEYQPHDENGNPTGSPIKIGWDIGSSIET